MFFSFNEKTLGYAFPMSHKTSAAQAPGKYNPAKILFGLEEELSAFQLSEKHVARLAVDKWILSSNLQKAIRRGEQDIAIRSACALWHVDKRSLWRRIHVIALEDVGIADTELMTKTLTAYSNPAWREKRGDCKVAMLLAGMLANAAKSRIADELYLYIERSPDYRTLRDNLAKADNEALAKYALHEQSPLPERALALWTLAGKKFPSDFMPPRKGSIEEVVKVFKALNVSANVKEPCLSVLTKTQWPLTLFTPLIWQERQKDKAFVIEWLEPYSLSPSYGGVLYAACDQYTSIGQTCIRSWREAVVDLKQFTVKQIGMALFFEEGSKTNRTLTSKKLEEIRQESEIVFMESLGVIGMPEHLGLRDLVVKNMHVLNAIREEKLKKLLGPQDGMVIN